jgi:phage tail-like protein
VTDWLLSQLPQVMQDNVLITAFVHGCGEVTETVRGRLDGLEHELDVDLASPQMLRYVAGWLGVQLDALPPAADQDARDAQRRLIRAVTATLGWRGTVYGVEELLKALTGGRAEVSDDGGVWVGAAPQPPGSRVVSVVLDTYGTLAKSQVEAFLADEVPVGSVVRIRLRSEADDG